MEGSECRRCKHKMPKEICGSSQSPYYNQVIESTNSCSYFLENPAQDHFMMGLRKRIDALDQGIPTSPEAARELEIAIKLGLPHDDEMTARFFLGESLASLNESEAANQMEKSVMMDSEGGYGYFLEPINRSRLIRLDLLYALVSHSIQEKEGIDAAIAYLKEKLPLFDYLPSTPGLNMLLRLENLYYEKGEIEHARESCKKILEADVVDPVDETGQEARTRQMAKNNLELLESKGEKKSGCFIVTAVYVNEDAPEVKMFRRFRNEVLFSYSIGRKLVSIYYLVSPYVATLISKSIFVRSIIKTAVLKPAMWLIKHTINKKVTSQEGR